MMSQPVAYSQGTYSLVKAFGALVVHKRDRQVHGPTSLKNTPVSCSHGVVPTRRASSFGASTSSTASLGGDVLSSSQTRHHPKPRCTLAAIILCRFYVTRLDHRSLPIPLTVLEPNHAEAMQWLYFKRRSFPVLSQNYRRLVARDDGRVTQFGVCCETGCPGFRQPCFIYAWGEVRQTLNTPFRLS